ncbi:MAG TPA: transposase [Pedomonas sp.]
MKPLITDLLERIKALYKIEDDIRGQPPEERRRQRQERSKPLIDDLRTAIDEALRRLSPKSAMARALLYGRKRWAALTRFLEDGHAEIDNNIAERAMRSVAMGESLCTPSSSLCKHWKRIRVSEAIRAIFSGCGGFDLR